MKYRESGMPPEKIWDSFFNPSEVLKKMGISQSIDLIVDIGCGYGTFILPASSVVKRAIGIDIDSDLLECCQKVITERGITNIELIVDDASSSSYNAHMGSADYVALFNILHCEDPISLLRKAKLMLKPGGRTGVIHWKNEETPRGPSMDIRPKPQQVTEWATSIGLTLEGQVDLPPYHYGLVFKN